MQYLCAKNKIRIGLAECALWSAVSFATVLAFNCVLTHPAQAADSKIGITLNAPEVVLKRDKNLYQSGINTITVNSELPGGFSVTLSADNANLVDSKDSTHLIKPFKSSKTTKVSGLAENQWGYRMGDQDNFSTLSAKGAEAIIIDNDGKNLNGCKSANQCAKNIMFAANINPNNLASGEYSAKVTYTATPKLNPPHGGDQGSAAVCRSGNSNNLCKVDLDTNMIPVKYTGTTSNAQWTSLAAPENPKQQGDWYDYDKKQWANAVTVRNPQDYKGQAKTVEQADILGFWVYIPRYRYKVLRFKPEDPAVTPQDFTIEFETKDSKKATPTASGTWATHPAFTFGSKELNGIWFGKFETTGDVLQPTVLPNERHVSGWDSGISQLGGFYGLAKSMGVDDPANVGGNPVTTAANNHHLATYNSRMVNNKDWGAAVYLASSKYGAGHDKVRVNGSVEARTDLSGKNISNGTTGCGPYSENSAETYGVDSKAPNQLPAGAKLSRHPDEAGGVTGTQGACTATKPDRAYNGTIGQYASTTNNPTGIYDLAGGSIEYVAANYNTTLTNSSIETSAIKAFTVSAKPPYVNIYNFRVVSQCTFELCGGQALYETSYGNVTEKNQWGSENSMFVYPNAAWLMRNVSAHDLTKGGMFSFGSGSGGTGIGIGFRTTLGDFR